jgi:hypothetical protein
MLLSMTASLRLRQSTTVGAVPKTIFATELVLMQFHIALDVLVSDHGTEFTCNVMLAWSKDTVIDWYSSHRANRCRTASSRVSMAGCAMSRSTRLCSSILTLKYLTPVSYTAHVTATDDRLRNTDQFRRSSVAPPA